MKKLLIITLFLLAATGLFANNKRFGIGVGGGTMFSGVSGKMLLSDHTAVQGILGFVGGDGFALGADFIMEIPPYLVKNADVTLAWYVGAGAAVLHYSYSYYYGSSSNNYSWNTYGISGVLGLSLMLQRFPLEFTLEWRPTFFIDGNGNDNFSYGFSGLYLPGSGGSIRFFI